MKLTADDLPWDNVQKAYRLRLAGCDESFPGVTFRDGESVEPVDAITAKRLYLELPDLVILPWESSADTHVDAFSSEAFSVAEGGDAAYVYEFSSEAFSVAEKETQPTFAEREEDELDAMTRDELHGLATALRLRPHWKAGAKKLKAMIRNARDRA